MKFRKFLGGLQYAMIAALALYDSHFFKGGGIVRCSEMLACTDPEGVIAQNFEPSLCKTENIAREDAAAFEVRKTTMHII